MSVFAEGVDREAAAQSWSILNIIYGIFVGLLELSEAIGRARGDLGMHQCRRRGAAGLGKAELIERP